MIDDSAFYNDLEGSLDQARSLLIRGAKDRKSPAHHAIVGSLGPDGYPEQRVMILRAVDWENRTVRFHTDARSAKVGQYQDNQTASVLIYDPGKKIQLRLKGTVRIETDGSACEQAWTNSTTFARRCYMAEASPGTASDLPTSGLPHWIEGLQPNEDQVTPARENFAILLIQFDQIEWLYLVNSGHRRARWTWDGNDEQDGNGKRDDWQGTWLVP